MYIRIHRSQSEYDVGSIDHAPYVSCFSFVIAASMSHADRIRKERGNLTYRSWAYLVPSIYNR